MTIFIVLSSWQSHCESSLGSRDEYSTAPGGRWVGPSPFIIITQPKSWYSVYRPTERRRLSRWVDTFRRQRYFTQKSAAIWCVQWAYAASAQLFFACWFYSMPISGYHTIPQPIWPLEVQVNFHGRRAQMKKHGAWSRCCQSGTWRQMRGWVASIRQRGRTSDVTAMERALIQLADGEWSWTRIVASPCQQNTGRLTWVIGFVPAQPFGHPPRLHHHPSPHAYNETNLRKLNGRRWIGSERCSSDGTGRLIIRRDPETPNDISTTVYRRWKCKTGKWRTRDTHRPINSDK